MRKIYKFVILLSVFFLCACGGIDSGLHPVDSGNTEESATKIRDRQAVMTRRGGVETETEEIILTSAERAKLLSEFVTDIDGITEASVVVSGNTAIIGIKAAGHLDDMLLLKLKREIESIIKAADSGIRNVAVTAKPELYDRVANMTNSGISHRDDR